MPVFVEWKWQETKSFLVIFHFYDDFSRTNLRMRKFDKGRLVMLTSSAILEPQKAWMTWSPSHLEIALLSELLSYANIINGLKESRRNEIRLELEGKLELLRCGFYNTPLDAIMNEEPQSLFDNISRMPDKKIVIYPTDSGELSSFVELCPEYIDYLKKLLKPYLKQTSG